MKRKLPKTRSNRRRNKTAALLCLLLTLSPVTNVLATTPETEKTTESESSSETSSTDTGSSTGTNSTDTGSSTSTSSSNKTISDANEKKNQAEQNLSSINNQISGIQSRQNALQSEMNALDAELSDLLVNIAILEDELTQTEAELAQVNADLAVAEDKERTEYANMKLRIRYMYENSDSTLVSSIFGASDFTDFLNRLEYVESMYTYDRNLLTTYQQTVADVTDLREAVLDTQDELEEIQTEYEAQQEALTAAIAQKRAEKSDFDAQLVSAQALAAEYSKTIAEQNAIIKEEQRKQEEERKRKEAEAKAKAAAAAANSKTAANNGSDNSGTGTGSSSGDADKTDSGTTVDTGGSTSGGSADGGAAVQNPGYTTGVSGSDVVNYAMQFVGNPYVLGGTSLTDGCDCSGFTQSVYAHFGISLPRTSGSQALVGSAVSYEAAQPGDLMCYVGHVGIYIGGGQIVNASTQRTGIKTQSATYRTILTIRRVL